MIGSLAIVLHAHLPWVRHPEHDRFLEEYWLFEAVAECYLPLLRQIRGWDRDRVDWRLSVGVSPTLVAMWSDPLLRSRTRRYLMERRELARSECERTTLLPPQQSVARFHAGFFDQVWQEWMACGEDLVGAFSLWARTGRLELLGGPATHPILPLLAGEPGSLQAQLALGLGEHARHFGARPAGLWLPECAWAPALERPLIAHGVSHGVLETHGILRGTPPSPTSVFLPVRSPGGLTFFGRDPWSARQVWSRQVGYPGDPRYREFHSDLADEAEWESVSRFLSGAGVRSPSGLKYRRVTGGDSEKEWYDRSAALHAVQGHVLHFLLNRRHQLRLAGEALTRPPVAVVPYDAELFGHWWFEGPEFLDLVMRQASGFGIVPETLSAASAANHEAWSSQPAESSWGAGGHLGVWLDPSNADLQPRLRSAGSRMTAVARVAAAAGGSRGLLLRDWARKAGRELMLAQASDWPFLIRMGTAAAYARRRVDAHLEAFERLARGVLDGGDPGGGTLAHRRWPGEGFPEPDLSSWTGRMFNEGASHRASVGIVRSPHRRDRVAVTASPGNLSRIPQDDRRRSNSGVDDSFPGSFESPRPRHRNLNTPSA